MCVRISPQGEAEGGAARSTAGAEAKAEAWPEPEAGTEAEAETSNPGGPLRHRECPSFAQLVGPAGAALLLVAGGLCSG